MTDDEKLMQQALEAMLNFPDDISDEMFESIKALRERLAHPEQPSVPWSAALESVWGETEQAIPEAEIYKREWVGLTDEDKQTAVWTNGTFGAGALWAEAKLKEKNGG